MLIALIRGHYGENETLGKLYANGEFECYTCEDKMREVPGKRISEWKVYGKTAIPTGQYDGLLHRLRGD